MENYKNPNIRFKGFTDPWEQRKFNELVIIERGGSPRPIDKFITNDANGLNWVKIGDAPQQGNYITKTAEKIIPEGLSKTREVHPGDLILSNSMSFGKPYIMAINGCIHDGWLLIRDTNKVFDLKFLCQMLGAEQMLSQYKALAAGSTVNNLNKELVGNTNVTVPNIKEQQQIGEYFSNLDNLITLHQRKYSKLLNVKKSMLEKMFPKNGSNIPEIRFKGFTDPWEQRKLGELSSSFEYGLNAAAKEYDGENKYIRITDIDDESREFKQEDITSPDTDLSSAENYKLSEGDILFARTGASVGKSYIYKASDGLVYYAGFLIRARIKPEYNSEFVFQNTLTGNYEKFIKVTSMRSGQPGVNAQEYSQYQIMMPSKPEQDKISDCLRNLDNLITLHQRELEKLQNIKKSMLEKMFV